MAKTEKNLAGPNTRSPRDLPLEVSSDIETFCKNSIELLQLTRPGSTVILHEYFPQLEECGKRCQFCRYVYKSFGDEMEKLTERYKETEFGLYVDATLNRIEARQHHKLAEKSRISVYVREKDVWRNRRPGENIHGSVTFEILSNGARGMDRAVWSSPSQITFDARVPTLSQWLSECVNEHPKCRNTIKPGAPSAARILEVLTADSNSTLRLVSTDGLNRDTMQYAVLSHCWGGVEIPTKTTMSNVDKYLKFIDIETLPKTFREAIHIVRALQLRYLWIDSLCIIQQDAEDWEHESTKMAAIFRNATLTISASTAENSTKGCGLTTVLPPSKQFTIPSYAAQDKSQPFVCFRKINWDHDWGQRLQKQFGGFPIHKRAWIFQEKILSRRILHATHGFFIYQCATHIESEDSALYHYGDRVDNCDATFLDSHVPNHVGIPTADRVRLYGDIRKRWWEWVEDFTKRQLSQVEDNYAAFAGVTALYQELTGDEPVLGLWKRDLVVHLSWEVQMTDVAKARVSADPRARRRLPTWTWMSYSHGTVPMGLWFTDFEDRTVSHRSLSSTRCYKAKVVDVNIHWTGRPLVSLPSLATIKLRGFMHQLSLRVRADWRNPRWNLDPGIPKPKVDTCYDVFALYANRSEPILTNKPDHLSTVYLVVEAVDQANNTYRRMGRVVFVEPIEFGKATEDFLFGSYEEIVLV